MALDARNGAAARFAPRPRVRSRLSRAAFLAAALLALGSARVLAAEPPEELRMGLLGERGVTFRDQAPWKLTEHAFAAGDVNGDGLADFLLLRRDTSADYEGEILLVYGSRDPWPRAPTMAEVKSRSSVLRRSTARSEPSDILEDSRAAGDVDGDGFDDLFVLRWAGAPEGWEDPAVSPGLVYLVHGAADLPSEIPLDTPPEGVRIVLFTSSKPTRTVLASDVATGGDVSGDGLPDLAIGASGAESEVPATEYGPGRVYVLFGGAPLEGTLDVEEIGRSLPGFILEGEANGEAVGRTVEMPGDVDGDGIGDLLVGAPSSIGSYPGYVYLVRGSSDRPRLTTVGELLARGEGVRFVGAGSAADAGRTLASPGDLNADGLADFLVGSPGAEGQKGAVYLVYGRRDFPASVRLEDLAGSGMGAKLAGTHPRPPLPGAPVPTESGRAGDALDVIRWDSDAIPDILIGCPRFEVDGVSDVGKVAIVRGAALPPGTYKLGEIETGELPGSVVTWERKGWLGSTAAALGDVDGDGREDLLVSAPFRYQADETPEVYLIHGRGDGPDALGLERVAPRVAPVAGGTEALVVGRGFDASAEVLVGGRPAIVLRVDTTARLAIEVPAADAPGVADVEVRRGGDTASLPGAVRYVPRVHADIDLATAPAEGQAMRVDGLQFAPVLVDLDGDGLADLVTSLPRVAGLCVTWGRPDPPAGLDLPPTVRGAGGAEGFSLVWGEEWAQSLVAVPVGDVDGDGRADVAATSVGATALVFGGARLPREVWLEDLLADGLGARIDWTSTGFNWPRIAGGGDLDGDGVGDVVFGDNGTVRIVRGARRWPRDQSLEDLPWLGSGAAEDRFGDAIAIAGDVDADGRDEILLGAQGAFWRDDGNGYLLRGGMPLAAERIEDLVARGDAARFDAFQAKDGLGHDVCALGDFDGDGIPDLALSAEGGGIEFAGECYVVFGGPSLFEGLAPHVLSMRDLGGRGVRISGEIGYDYSDQIEPAGDFNGDGLADLMIASSDIRSSPEVYIVFGGPARALDLGEFQGEGVRILCPAAVRKDMAGGGDFDGDGVDDVALGGTKDPSGLGLRSVYVVFGSASDPRFVRGDASGDGDVVISDPISLLGALFLGGPAPPCDDAGDANDDGKLDIADAIYVLSHLFLGGPEPPAPYPDAGPDPTADALDCGGS